jgi:hypothetical protein
VLLCKPEEPHQDWDLEKDNVIRIDIENSRALKFESQGVEGKYMKIPPVRLSEAQDAVDKALVNRTDPLGGIGTKTHFPQATVYVQGIEVVLNVKTDCAHWKNSPEIVDSGGGLHCST